MKQSLQLRLGQQLTMTPQLQQAIRLLQLSTLELQVEIQQALESNLMLEQEEEEEELEAYPAETEQPEREESDPVEATEIPEELPVDSSWEDSYDTGTTPGPQPDGDGRELEQSDRQGESLREHLLWQMELATLSPTDRLIAEAIIDAIDEDGFLRIPLSEIQSTLGAEVPVEPDEVEAVLHAVQNFDPPGVAARDLQESLLLQLRLLEGEVPWRRTAEVLVSRHFDLLARRDYTQLKRRLKLDEASLVELLRLIQSLNPRPGAQISGNRTEYIIPDVVVRKVKGVWRVELSPAATPRIRVNQTYAEMLKQVDKATDVTTLKNQLQEARWFIKSLQSRNETLLKVASAIVARQQGFLEQGEVAMRSLVLHDIAEEVGMHESTISRVTTRKYMHTPRGVFELKYFFSSHVGTADGGECSSTAIRALIRKLVGEENPAKPLSDNKIAGLLKEQGINVARRTVAKYREAMAIPPSNERKRLA